MHRFAIFVAFFFSALSLPLVQSVIAAALGMDFEPSFDNGAAMAALFWVGVAIYFKIGSQSK